MTEEIKGYYTEKKEALLKAFEQTGTLLSKPLATRYGAGFAETLQGEMIQEYEKLIPEIPYIKGDMRTRMLNYFLLITAQELAVYKALKKHGKSPAEVFELCDEMLRLKLAAIPGWKRSLTGAVMLSGLVTRIINRRARKKEINYFGKFTVEYVGGQKQTFDYGINYHSCSNYEFLKEQDAEEFAPYVCMSDLALSDAFNWGLIRTQTLADGCDYCDFRFQKGAPTQITSRTPEVQEAIEALR